MRVSTIVLAIAAVLAAPGALAMDQVILTVPDASIHVEGTTVDADTTELSPVPIGVVGAVTIQDVDVSLSETRCAVSTDLNLKSQGDAGEACQTGSVQTSRAPEHIVTYDLDLLLPSTAAPAAQEQPDAMETETATVGAPLETPTVLLAAAAAGASFVGLYGAWRILKWTGLAAFLPLYSHISDDEILDDPNRAAIYRLIQAEAGISTKDVAERLGLAWGTVTHHLGKLEKRRFVVSKKYGKYRRYFANGSGGTEKKDELAVLRLDRTGDVAALIQANPGVTQKAVSIALGVSSSTILWHVKRLEEVRLVTKVREGKLVRYYPAEGLNGATVIPAVPVHAA